MLKRYDLHASRHTLHDSAGSTPCSSSALCGVPVAAPGAARADPVCLARGAVWGGLAAGLPTPGALAHC